MRQFNLIIILMALTFSSATIASCQNSNPYVKQLTVKEFVEQIKQAKGAVILDVRTPEEFADGHIPGAINVDFFGNDFDAQIKNLDPQKQYYVYCASGNRSGQATNKMAETGFRNLYNLHDGGYKDWLRINK